MTRLFTFCTFVVFSVAISGCKKALENPSAIDPIYIDLMKEHAQFDGLVKTAEKSFDVATKELEAAEVGSLDKKIKLREREKASEQIQKYKQMSEYFRIRAQLRLAWGKKEYLLVFQKDPEAVWPDPADVKAYFVNKKLHLLPKNWSARVPGSPYYNSEQFGDSAKKPDKDAKSSGH